MKQSLLFNWTADAEMLAGNKTDRPHHQSTMTIILVSCCLDDSYTHSRAHLCRRHGSHTSPCSSIWLISGFGNWIFHHQHEGAHNYTHRYTWPFKHPEGQTGFLRWPSTKWGNVPLSCVPSVNYSSQCATTPNGPNIGASKTRIGFWGPL